jgi:hypothetical protein
MPTRPAARLSARRLLLAGALAMLPLLGGCKYNEGGPGYSGDIHTYVSTAWRPWTVTLVDTRTGEAVWSADIPVDQQLVIRFRTGKGPSDELPDMMDWGLMEAGTKYGHRKNRLPVPGADARLLKPTLRPTPEMPGAVLTSAPEAPDEIMEMTPMGDGPAMDEPMDEEPMDSMDHHDGHMNSDGQMDHEEPEGDEPPIDLPDGE